MNRKQLILGFWDVVIAQKADSIRSFFCPMLQSDGITRMSSFLLKSSLLLTVSILIAGKVKSNG